MAVKILDMKKSVYDLATEFPEVIDIMVTLVRKLRALI